MAHPSPPPGDSDVLRINASSTVLRLLGFCFLLAGVLLFALLLGALTVGRAGAISLVTMAVFGLCFTLAGLVVSENTTILVDKGAASLTITSKWAGWQEKELYPLSDFQRVAIVRDWNRSRHGPRKLYRIVFERSSDKGDSVCLVDPAGSAQAARSIASQLSRFTNLPLRVVDCTSPVAR